MKRILNVLKKIKEETLELTDMLGTIELHLKLIMPKKTPSTSFNEAVIDEILTELKLSSLLGSVVSTRLNEYLLTRAQKLQLKLKEPCEIEDSIISLKEFDYNRNVLVQRWLTDIEQLRIVLYDLINKNVSNFVALKILKDNHSHPQNNNTSYYN